MISSWHSLLDESLLASVLPGEQARFARPIREGLTVFLSGLPAVDQGVILLSQAGLPATATISERLGLLARSCPVLHKLGQILARDRRLSLELRQQLRQLESLPPSVPLETIQRILVEELGPLESRGVTLTPPAIAEASVAVVIPFRQETGKQDQGVSQGVFKILKPGIEQRLEMELALLDRVGQHLDSRCDALRIPHLDYQESFQQVRDKLWDEVQLDQEQRHLAAANTFYAEEPRVHIPALLEHCTPRVTAMERITGGKVTDHRLDVARDKRRLAELVVQALVAFPIFSRSSRALFHSDPHAGNLFLTDENRLAILDWSLVGTLGEQERVAIVQIMLGAVMLHAGRIVAVLEGLSRGKKVDRTALERVVQGWLRRIRRGTLPGLSWLTGLLDEAVSTACLRVAPDLMLFRKSLHTLEGVVGDISSDAFRMDGVLLLDFLRHLALEWPRRWVTLPHSRQFATRLSNLDLSQTVLSSPATAARFWYGQGCDLLGVVCKSQ